MFLYISVVKRQLTQKSSCLGMCGCSTQDDIFSYLVVCGGAGWEGLWGLKGIVAFTSDQPDQLTQSQQRELLFFLLLPTCQPQSPPWVSLFPSWVSCLSAGVGTQPPSGFSPGTTHKSCPSQIWKH